MKPFIPFSGIPIGITSTFWFIIGFIRYFVDILQSFFGKKRKYNRFKKKNIAAIIPAHNEELAIRKCIQALKLSLNKKQIYVISDGSTDKTYQKARLEGCHVAKLAPGRGKAKALVYTLKRFRLYSRYKLIFIVDADTRIDKDFVKNALPLFNDFDIKVVFGTAKITWPRHILPRLSLYFVAYRERLNRMLQYFFTYGQTWKYTNTTYVIPGFATIFRSDTLRKIPIDTPGLLIEDFNTAFQMHKRHLGKIAYNPDCIGWDQPPESLSDYWKQVRRWNIGFFQTVKINGIWPSFYWLSLLAFTIEIFLNSIFMLFLPFLILYLFLNMFNFSLPEILWFKSFYKGFGPFTYVHPIDIFIALFIVDYGLTVIIGLVYKKPQFIFYGLFFFFMHFVTSLILITSVIPGFFSYSTGRWVSPKRSMQQMAVKI